MYTGITAAVTLVTLLQVSKTHPGFCSQAHVQQHTLKKNCSFPHAVSLQRNATGSVRIVCADPEEMRPADATGTGLGMSYAKSSFAIQCCVPVPTQCLHKPMSCQSSFHSADEE